MATTRIVAGALTALAAMVALRPELAGTLRRSPAGAGAAMAGMHE